jgi:hypothetical protein
LKKLACPDSSVVEHLHGKQKVVGSIPILGKLYKNKQQANRNILLELTEEIKWLKKRFSEISHT